MAKAIQENPTESRSRRGRALARRFVRWALFICLCLIAIPGLLVPIYAIVNPPITNTMLINRVGGASIHQDWVPLSEISPHLVRAVLVSEDERFCLHGGLDLRQMRKVIDEYLEGGSPRGASTITMQTVKNIFLWPERSYLRKAIEIPLALYADLIWSKQRTMELYLNIAEWDRGVYGAQLAALTYFNIQAAQINQRQAARLAVTLPAPDVRNPANPGPGMRRLAQSVERRASRSGAYVQCVLG